MLAYHITGAITACIIVAIPLTRANRLAAMRESDERITSIFTPFLRGPLRFTYALVIIIITTAPDTNSANVEEGPGLGCMLVFFGGKGAEGTF